jgi:hypothetical protein
MKASGSGARRARTAQAREEFEEYVRSEKERLAAFRRAVAARGGPAEGDLDTTRASLRPLGAWFLTPPPPGPEDADRPAWARDRPDDHPMARAAWMVDGLASYFAATLRRAHPSLAWRLDEDPRSQDEGRPVLSGFGQTELWPVRPVNVKLTQARAAPTPDPDWLVRLFDTWSGFVPATAAVPDAEVDLHDVSVDPIEGDPDWNAEIWIPESAESILGEREFEGLEGRFAALDGVERIGWEDRERFLVRLRPGTDLGDLREKVSAALRAARERAQSGSR